VKGEVAAVLFFAQRFERALRGENQAAQAILKV
jgi:hypothetical protein